MYFYKRLENSAKRDCDKNVFDIFSCKTKRNSQITIRWCVAGEAPGVNHGQRENSQREKTPNQHVDRGYRFEAVLYKRRDQAFEPVSTNSYDSNYVKFLKTTKQLWECSLLIARALIPTSRRAPFGPHDFEPKSGQTIFRTYRCALKWGGGPIHGFCCVTICGKAGRVLKPSPSDPVPHQHVMRSHVHGINTLYPPRRDT